MPNILAPAAGDAGVQTIGYAGLFPVGITLSNLGAFAVSPSKTTR